LALAVVAQLSVNASAGFAVKAFELVGPAGMVLLRNGISAVILLALVRPRWRGLTPQAWGAASLYGFSMVVMNSFFYEGIDRVPVGPAVTIEMLGPLALSVLLVRRWRAWMWAVLALGGVLMLSGFDFAGINIQGTVYVLVAGTAWAGYIVNARLVGRVFAGADGLAIGMAVAALASLPRGVPDLVARPDGIGVLGWGALVAALGTLIPYGLEMISLRGMSAATFGVTTALAPGSAALFGWWIAGQPLNWWTGVGMALVTIAAAGAALDESPGTLAAG
jgi:inner membrane transporter RhtA